MKQLFEKPLEEIIQISREKAMLERQLFLDKEFVFFRGVYPSYKFRSPKLIIDSLKEKFQGKVVCDMGCGPGVVGVFALHYGSKRVVQADINLQAVKNAEANKKLHNYSDEELLVIHSDCFDSFDNQAFDLIVFNVPFHNDAIQVNDPLEYAFYDPGFATLKKFLAQSKSHLSQSGEIFLAFTNRCDINLFESIISEYNFKFEIFNMINQDTKYDNRLYRLTTADAL